MNATYQASLIDMDGVYVVPVIEGLPIHYTGDGQFLDARSRNLFRLLLMHNANSHKGVTHKCRRVLMFLLRQMSNSPIIDQMSRSDIAMGSGLTCKSESVSKITKRLRLLGFLHEIYYGDGLAKGYVLCPIPYQWDITDILKVLQE